MTGPGEDGPVLQVMAGGRHGGAETFFVSLATALTHAGIPQAAAIRPHPERVAALSAEGIPVTGMRFGGPLDLVTPWRLRRLARRLRPRAVMAWMSRAAATMPRGPYPLLARLGNYYDLKYFRRCDHLVAITPDIARFCRDGGWPADRVHYIPNFARIRRSPPVDRAVFGTPTDVPLLVALGRLHENKAMDVAIRALADVPRAHLWIAGEGPLRDALTALAADCGVAGRVRFLGWQDDVSRLLGAADVCVFPSRVEPHGTVTLEAWAHEVPIVAAASVGPAAHIEDRVTGRLAAIDDAAALAAAINEVVADPEAGRAMAAAGSRAYEETFTEAAVVARYRALFDRLSGEAPAA